MILSDITLLKLLNYNPPLIEPWSTRAEFNGMTYGLGPAGYDIRIAEEITLSRNDFVLAYSLERFHMPNNLLAMVKDKSSWARRGLAVQNTVIEPGWRGYLTLEITNHGPTSIHVPSGCPIAQVIFYQVDQHVLHPYDGRYQDQGPEAVPAEGIEV